MIKLMKREHVKTWQQFAEARLFVDVNMMSSGTVLVVEEAIMLHSPSSTKRRRLGSPGTALARQVRHLSGRLASPYLALGASCPEARPKVKPLNGKLRVRRLFRPSF